MSQPPLVNLLWDFIENGQSSYGLDFFELREKVREQVEQAPPADITLFPLSPLAPVGNIEVHGCRAHGEAIEQVTDHQAQFFSVYLRYQQNEQGVGGLDCIADCPTRERAEELGKFLTTLMKLEV